MAIHEFADLYNVKSLLYDESAMTNIVNEALIVTCGTIPHLEYSRLAIGDEIVYTYIIPSAHIIIHLKGEQGTVDCMAFDNKINYNRIVLLIAVNSSDGSGTSQKPNIRLKK